MRTKRIRLGLAGSHDLTGVVDCSHLSSIAAEGAEIGPSSHIPEEALGRYAQRVRVGSRDKSTRRIGSDESDDSAGWFGADHAEVDNGKRRRIRIRRRCAAVAAGDELDGQKDPRWPGPHDGIIHPEGEPRSMSFHLAAVSRKLSSDNGFPSPTLRLVKPVFPLLTPLPA